MVTTSFLTRYFAVNRSDIAYLRFIIESYEGLATLSTMDGKKGIVSLSSPRCFAGEVDRLVHALKSEIMITEITFTGGGPDGGDPPAKQEHNANA